MTCKCLFPQSCVSHVIKSHWSSKSNFLGVLSVFVRFPQVGEFLWALELLQQCENFFDIIVLQFEGHLLGGSTAGLMANSSKRIYATRHAPMSAKAPAPCPHGRPLLTCAPTGTLGHSKAGLIQFFVGSLGSGAPRVLFEPSKHLWWVWGLILNAISLLQLSCWGFSLALG